MSTLSEAEIAERLKSLPGWHLEGKQIVRVFEFRDFLTAMRFVNAVAGEAESAGHHPDIDIRYNKVKLALTSHDGGGITERDVKLAESLKTLSQAS